MHVIMLITVHTAWTDCSWFFLLIALSHFTMRYFRTCRQTWSVFLNFCGCHCIVLQSFEKDRSKYPFASVSFSKSPTAKSLNQLHIPLLTLLSNQEKDIYPLDYLTEQKCYLYLRYLELTSVWRSSNW